MLNIYLSTEENKALSLFAEKISPTIVRREMDIPKVRWDHFTLILRRKTGIANHKDERQCQDYLARYAKAPMKLEPKQVEIFRRLVNGETLEGAAYIMRISQDELHGLINQACMNAAIFTQHPRTRLLQMRTFLSVHYSTNGKPLTETEIAAFRLIAKGYRPQQVYLELGGKERYFVNLIRGACLRLGFNVSGKGTQRRMIIDYLARLDAQEPAPVTMDDPMF